MSSLPPAGRTGGPPAHGTGPLPRPGAHPAAGPLPPRPPAPRSTATEPGATSVRHVAGAPAAWGADVGPAGDPDDDRSVPGMPWGTPRPAPDDEWGTGSPDDTGPLPIIGALPAPPPRPRPSRAPVIGPDPADVAPGRADVDRPPGRAGRNLAAAIAVGLGLGAVILGSLLVWRPAFLAVLGAAVLVATVELTRALDAGDFRPPLPPLLIGGPAMIALAWTRGPTGLVVAFLLTVLAVLLWRLADGPSAYLRDAAAGVLVALYVPLLAGFAALMLVPDDGTARVLAFIATVVASDVGGYAVGVLFGRHPLARRISPKKSWEGLVGSILMCCWVAMSLFVLALDAPWWGGVLFGAAVAVSATVGDLGESLIKRDLGIKDMGKLLPGHGGIMDRLDSLLPTAAVAYLLLSVLAPV